MARIDFILNLYVADDRVEHMTLPATWADLASVLPILSIFVSDLKLLGIFRFFRCTRVIKLYRLQAETITAQTEDIQQLILTVFTCAAFVFVSSGIVHALDLLSDTNQFEGAQGTSLQFHEAFYFLIVTITTVGYGDVYPSADLSRCVMVVVMLLALGILPGQVARLSAASARYSPYRHPFQPNNETWQHVVLCGTPTEGGIDPGTVETIVKEFMHQDVGKVKTHLVILAPYEPPDEIVALLEHGKYETRLKYVKVDSLIVL